MIKIVGHQLTQWDTGRQVEVSSSNATHIHFANQGDARAVIMDIVNGQAKIPDYLLQTGKGLCVYLVLDGVTQESKSFYVTKRERPENYIYEEDKRNYVYELIASAESAIEEANTAAGNANKATANANVATESATEASKNANDAANSATLAADNANKAATQAAHTAKSLMVVGGAEGEAIALDDAIDQVLVGLRVFGKTTQDGTPTPDAPVELVSVGDSGSITVNVAGEYDAQSMTIATPNGLPGIPVTSGGNYTDASGQQWICDEIDFARGVYVRRIKELEFNGSENWSLYDAQNTYYGLGVLDVLDAVYARTPGVCNQFTVQTVASPEENAAWLGVNNAVVFLLTREWYNKGVSAWKEYLSTNPLRIAYKIATPIETPLSEEELAAYASLHTYRDHTTVSNDASAHMELEYVMDAKKYIDSLVNPSGIIPATVE